VDWNLGTELELVDVACERDERVLFSGLSYRFSGGQVVQIEGPNGSGKTTLLRILTTLSDDYSGEIRWCGEPIKANRFDFLSNLLYLGHLPGVKKNLSPMENLRWYCGLTGGPRSAIEQALQNVGLYGYEDVPCFQLSAGQQRRVALARLYLNTPAIWVLDEPFTAIDKRGVTALEHRISEHAAAGGTVILTTHQDMLTPELRKISLLDYQVAGAA